MPAADAPGMHGEDRARYRFGDVEVDTHARTVTRGGELQMLEPKAYEVLLCLLRHAGELVTHEDLLDHVWGHRHVTPGVLTRAIAQLRHALGDDAYAPKYIRTRHSLGYCFIGILLDDPAGTRPDPDADPNPRSGKTQTSSPAAPVDPEHAAPQPTPDAQPDGPLPMETGVAEGARPGARVAAASDTAAASGAASGPPRRALSHPDAVDGPALAPDDSPRNRRRGLATPPWIALVVVAALAIALAVAVAMFAFKRAPAEPPADPSIAVLPFTSPGDSRDGRYFAEGLALEMHDALARVPGLQVVAVPPTRGGDPPDAATVGRRLHVAHVLEASVQRDGEHMRIDARLTEPKNGRTRWSGRFDRADADVFAVQAEIAQEVARALLGALADRRFVERLAPTRSPDAYDAYLLGLQHLHAHDGEAGLQRAIDHFREALVADPRFARAQAGICRAEIERFENGLSAAAFERADEACGRAAAMAPQLREVDLALGQLHRASGAHMRAMRHFTRALDDVALRLAAHVGLGRTYDALDRRDDADTQFAQALQLSPNDASIHRELGYRAYLAGDLDRAIDAYRTATTLAPNDERLWSSLGGLQLASGDVGRAADSFERSLAVRPNYAALSNYGSLRYEARAYAQAGELYRKAAALDPADFRIWGNLGDALSASGDAAGARDAYRRAAALAQRYAVIRSDDAQALALLGWYRANLGDAPAAQALLARADALGTEPAEVSFLAAQASALLGRTSSARVQLERAQGAGISDARLAASPVLAPLLQGERVARD